jgi:arsenate reductase
MAAKSIGRTEAKMKARIWHNPNCGTSRKTLDILEEAGAEVDVIHYLKQVPTKEELRRLYQRAGISPRDGLRSREEQTRSLIEAGADDEAILDAMVANPILIERPLVETDKGVRLCRPQDKVRELL